MAGEPMGTPQLRVLCKQHSAHYDLRFYGSQDFLVPCWWLGIFDGGELQATEVLHGRERTPDDVLRWLSPIAGTDIAARLVRMGMKAVREGSNGCEAVGAG